MSIMGDREDHVSRSRVKFVLGYLIIDDLGGMMFNKHAEKLDNIGVLVGRSGNAEKDNDIEYFWTKLFDEWQSANRRYQKMMDAHLVARSITRCQCQSKAKAPDQNHLQAQDHRPTASGT